MSKEWTIIENQEYLRTIKLIPKHIRDKVENELKSQMEEYPFVNNADKYPLQNKCKGFYEQKIENYRLVFRILDYNSKKIEFSWIRSKPHATAKRWIS
jgi:mRNA-degrading endonuclease RelE of RelBE toxin-antitoxin system